MNLSLPYGGFPLVLSAIGTGTGKWKMNKYLIFNRETVTTVTCAKITLRFDWLSKSSKSAAFAKIIRLVIIAFPVELTDETKRTGERKIIKLPMLT